MEKIIENPDAPIILTSWIGIYNKTFEYKKDKINLLLSKPNVKFIQLPFTPKDLVKLFEEQKEDKEAIIKSISFKMGIDKEMILYQMIENIIANMMAIDISGLKNAFFVDILARTSEHQSLQELHGIELAWDVLQKNPEQKMLICTPISGESLEGLVKLARKTDKFNLVRSAKNVRFFEYQDDIKKLEHIFDAPNESNEDILNTLQFYEVNGRYPYLKEFFATLDLGKLNLKNSGVVDLRADEAGWEDMSGLRIANETLEKNPDAKIILCSLIPIDVFKKVIEGTKSEAYLNSLLQGKNVRIIQSSGGNSMSNEEVLAQFDGMYKDADTSATSEGTKAFKKLSALESETAFQKVLEGEVSHFLHDAGYRLERNELKDLPYEDHLEYFFKQPQERKSDKRIAFENKLIGLLQFQHSSYKNVSRERNLGGILDTYKYIKQQVLPEGTRFEGVFVDRDGCLYDNTKKEFNQAVIKLMKEYEAQGKEVGIWTLGNIEIKQKLLDEAGLSYKVKSKIDYK